MLILPRRIPALKMKLLPGLSLVLVLAVALAVLTIKLWPLPPPTSVSQLTGDPKRGAYLARLSGCVACHTAGGEEPLSGGAALNSKFGAFFAPNITPDTLYGIGGWSFEQFVRAVRQGVSPEGAPYYPAFPYEFYASLTDQDMADIWAAVQAVPPVAQPSTPHQVGFPFNVRDGIRVWRSFFEQPRTYVEDTSRSISWNRGKYMVQGPAHCAACHTPRNIAGGLISDRELTGDPAMQDGGRSPAITWRALTVRGWTKDALVAALRTGVLPDGDAFGGSMAEVVHGGTKYLLDQHLEDMATYLLNLE